MKSRDIYVEADDQLAQYMYWASYDRYLEDVCRTLMQTGEVFVKKDDLFVVSRYLREKGVLPEQWQEEPYIDGWFLILTTI